MGDILNTKNSNTPVRSISHEFLDYLLEGCQVIGFDWKYLYLNNAAVIHSRQCKEKLIGSTMMEAYPGIENTQVFSFLRQCMEDRKPHQMENEFTFPDGGKGWFELRFEPVPEGVFILSIDITERKKAEANLLHTEEQLRHAQKMEAVGKLAAGMAHDFNNLLTIIALYSNLLLKRLPASDPVREEIEQIKKAGERGASLIRQLLAFTRQQVLKPMVLNLNELVSNARKMLRRLIGEDITLVTFLDPTLGHVKADPSQIEQVIMNLVINARDAMPRGGTLTIETHNVELDESYTQTHPEVPPGSFVILTLADTGCGMDKTTQSHIFEPFFTTKEKGKGTGLGLSTVFGIVKQSGGYIWVYSEPGHGSVFKIYLPLVKEEISSRKTPISHSSLIGTETILLVEDEKKVRTITAFTLRMFGYSVLQASHVHEAIQLCEQHKSSIHLLISDVIMPEMGGQKVADTIRALRPEIKVLYISGYTDDAVMRHGIMPEQVVFLQKPFTPDSLARKVRDALNQ